MINNSQITNVNNTLSTKQPIACQMSSSNDPNSPSTLQNIKCEAFATSPKEEINTKNHDIGDEKNLNLRECDISPTTNLPTHAQKNNNKYMKSTRTEVSPKSGENANSKSLIAKNEKLTPDTEEANNDNKLSTKRSAAGQIKDEELDKPLTEKASGSNTISKENDDVLNSLGNIKKEEENSPQLSPGPFDTLESGNPTSVDNAIHGKFNENKNAIVNNQKERLLGAPLNSEESLAFNAANNNQINEHNPHYLISSSNNNSNFMQEFMQQQNHIFVFSTQLANKGAESVINGHFPTIIAYHCMQPATKNFLEDFFIKNPMKVTKLQRQNSMNFCNANMQVNNSVQWLNMCNSKIAQNKHSANKNLSNVSSSIDNIKGGVPPSVRGGINNTYSEAHDALGNENEFMCWDQIRQSVEGESLKALDGASILRHQHSTNKSLNFMESNDNNVPSLQGVKVPDENLTPQQRQHREEQLAKLKKMNQFLFPENGSDFKVDGGVGGTGGGGGGSGGGGGVGSQSNMGGSKVSTENVPNILLCNQMNAAQLNAAVQNSSNNVPGVNPQLNCNNENIATINDEHTLPSEITAAQDSGRLQNNINKSTPRNNNNSNMSGPNGGNIASNTDLINELNNSNIPTCPSNKNIQLPSAQKMDDNHTPTTPQLDWSKPQNQFYDERKNKLSGDHSNSLNPSAINHNLRCGNQNNAININTGSRNIQGPPPPYHSTQRSASVPIVQSPNPSSPTNPTSNLSLPSPHTSVGQGNPENSPSLEVHPNLQSNVISNITTCGQTKTNFHQEGSPSNINRNRSGFSQLNSNPSTPLPNMSPKEVESYSNLGSTEFKNLRGNRPQTPRSPPNTNQTSLDQYNTDNRFNSTSPGTSFCQPSNGVNTLNAFKTGTIERQSSIPSNNQFGRRSENLPLNPNSARAAPSKPNTSFDPISSLAQMSQQLTNCTPHNQHIGPNSSVMNVGGMSDMGLLSNSNPGLENAMNPADSVLDNCGGNNSSTMGMLPTHGPGASFINNNCHQIMGPMGQRMLNPKLCGNFLQNPNNLRDGHGNMHPMGPVPRVGGNRMQMNFNNYNVSPNIQVKASTPNTIQYMPVRPQNNNNSLRPPPSLEFLQRYANPQMAMGVNMMDAGQIMQGNSVTNNEQHKFVGGNPNGNPGMNMYQNCNQSNLMNLDQDELQHGATVNDINLGGPMRGSRSMRQHPMQSRMHNMNAVNQTYGSIPQDSLECGTESAHIYNNMGENIIGSSQNFPNTQQKAIKNIGQPICQSTSNNINSMTNPAGLTNEHAVNMHPTLGNAAGIGGNSSGNNVPNVSSINNNGNYKYIGPTPNDLKYAQQYHSFQQQLYATSTRNPHGSTTNGVAANSSTNPNFFVNK